MTHFKTLDDVDVEGQRVLLRLDLNVPMERGVVSDATRIDRALPTVRELRKKGAKVIILSHFGRPKDGPDEENSLRQIKDTLAIHLGRPVTFARDCIGPLAEIAVANMYDGDVLLLENTRFRREEEANEPRFVKALAELGDIYVNDAFSCAHRAHASTAGLAHVLPAYVGRAMQAELEALDTALTSSARPLAAIVGGAKVSTKLALLDNLLAKVDTLIIGGGMANTFLLAQGFAIGKSLAEPDLVGTARAILEKARAAGKEIVLPLNVVVAKEFKANAAHRTSGVESVASDEMILDIGMGSIAHIRAVLEATKTLVWNGPFGAFELSPFDAGTVGVAKVAASLTKAHQLISVAGGGDTVSALNHAGVATDFTYLSTAGGAFLEWLEGKTLPGVAALEQVAREPAMM